MQLKYFLISLFIISFSINLVNALNSDLIIPCGGSENIIIGCLNSEDLFFIGSLIEEAEIPTGGQQPDLPEEPEPIIIEKEVPPPFISLTNLNQFLMSKGFTQLEIYIFEIFVFGGFFCWFIIIYKRSKEKKDKKQD